MITTNLINLKLIIMKTNLIIVIESYKSYKYYKRYKCYRIL